MAHFKVDVRAWVGQVTIMVGFGPIIKYVLSYDQPLGHGPFRSTFCEIFQCPRPKFWQTDKTDTA